MNLNDVHKSCTMQDPEGFGQEHDTLLNVLTTSMTPTISCERKLPEIQAPESDHLRFPIQSSHSQLPHKSSLEFTSDQHLPDRCNKLSSLTDRCQELVEEEHAESFG